MAYFKYQDKNIYFEEIGSGLPVMLLHGDTASSKMFELLLPLYQNSFQVILIDFLGNGRSDRVSAFPADLWFSQAKQVIALLDVSALRQSQFNRYKWRRVGSCQCSH